jgi:hypothetical protein
MNRVYGFMAVTGLLLIIGTAGACDFGNISLRQAMIQAFIGLVLFTAGCLLGKGGSR